jgi:2-C-methyl-D-erythritol 2,4-cyclodiphosphate synthase
VADLSERGWVVGNIDSTIIAQAPKMAPHILNMRAKLAADMNVDIDQVNVKATTTEKLGFAGRKEGIAAHAVVLITKAEQTSL